MAGRPERIPSSATAGFFQTYPAIPPAYSSSNGSNPGEHTLSDDDVLSNIVRLYLPDPLPVDLDKSFHDFARTCLDPRTLRLMVDCETNQPTLHPMTTFGQINDVNPLRTSEGWRALKDIQTRAGVVAHGYHAVDDSSASYNLRIHQFILAHLWSPSSASVSCPAAMSDGAAILLRKHISSSAINSSPGQDSKLLKQVLSEAYARLTSFDPDYAWTSGQWMTERPGGSDVSRTETVARLAVREALDAEQQTFGEAEMDNVGMPLGPWLVDGFKWFSSATDADMVVLLAQTQKGLSTFYAPMKRVRTLPDGSKVNVMNGIRISRLKNKLGTKGLPTAELEIKDMRAWLIGEEGKGVKEISAILNATRLWTACGAVGGWSRGLSVSRAYCKIRRIKGEQVLAENKQHLKWMADETVKYRACAHLAFLAVALLGICEKGWDIAAKGTRAAQWLPKDKGQADSLLRILTPVMKAQCSLSATLGLRECMESLGGVGYCENTDDGGIMNIARMFRDSSVNSIWEGTTNIMAEDFVRAAKGKDGEAALRILDEMFKRMLDVAAEFLTPQVDSTRQSWDHLRSVISKTSTPELLYRGREMLQSVQDIMCAALLLIDASSTRAKSESVVANRWVSPRFESHRKPQSRSVNRMYEENENDRGIFLGFDQSGPAQMQSKL